MEELFPTPRVSLNGESRLSVFPSLTSTHSVELDADEVRQAMLIIIQICGVVHEDGSVTCQIGDEAYDPEGFGEAGENTPVELAISAPSMDAAEAELMSRISGLFGWSDRGSEIIYGLTGGV